VNNTSYRFICPPINLSKEQRIQNLFQQIRDWIYSSEISELISAFNGNALKTNNIIDYITWLDDFANIWDYRKKQASGGERWMISDDGIVTKNESLIKAAAEKLGMVRRDEANTVPDYILPLGGAFLANFSRPALSREVYDLFNEPAISIVALSGMRPLTKEEVKATCSMSPMAKTEFDVISTGIEQAFCISSIEFEEHRFHTVNINLQWVIRKYICKDAPSKIFSLAAPSSDPARRANSFDTFRFFMDRFNVSAGQKLLLVTTSIYVPFQFMRFMPFAIDNNLVVDCIGASNSNPNSFNQASNYLQEIKGTINAFKFFIDKYANEISA